MRCLKSSCAAALVKEIVRLQQEKNRQERKGNTGEKGGHGVRGEKDRRASSLLNKYKPLGQVENERGKD